MKNIVFIYIYMHCFPMCYLTLATMLIDRYYFYYFYFSFLILLLAFPSFNFFLLLFIIDKESWGPSLYAALK